MRQRSTPKLALILGLLLCLCMGARLAYAKDDHDHDHEGHDHGSHGDHHGHDHDHDHEKEVSGPKSAPYPLSTCIVDGTKLGGKGKALSHTHGGRALKFCSDPCLHDYEDDPGKYGGKLDKEIIKQQVGKYPLTTDVVTGVKLGAKPVDFIYRNHLVRFASKDSIKKFEADPAKYLKKIADAKAKKS